MHSDKIVRTFFFREREVGYFEAEELLSKPGEYRYVPYRNVGHHESMRALATGQPQQCHFLSNGLKRYFTVRRFVKYGVLELGDFDIAS